MGAEGARILGVFGLAYEGMVKRHLEELPNNIFYRDGVEIYYKDCEGTVREIFNLQELHEKSLSIDGVFNNDGVVRFPKKDGKEVFLTRTPEKNWVRVWVPLEEEDAYTVKNILGFYDGFQNISFEEVATMPIQIGGAKTRELHEKAVYFELDLSKTRIEERFPIEDPVVAEFASMDYGQLLSQERLDI